jgi:diamine N-acetyltransferase
VSVEIRKITPENVGDACRITLRPGQDRYVAPVSYSLAQAYADPEVAWPRLVCEGDEVVAFVMGGFKDGDPLLHSTIWRLNVAGDAQGRGYGRFAVRAVAEEAKRRGRGELYTAYLLGEGSPEGFYRSLGFRPTGRSMDGIHEAVAAPEELLS